MRVLRRADHVEMRWKNGAGTSLQVASGGATGQPFDWRLSIARIESSGQFSNYDGYDRVTALVEGAGFTLRCAGAVELQFTRIGQCHSYPGAVPYACELHAGPCRDLNLIARQGMGASMGVVQVDRAGLAVNGEPATCCVLPLAGRVMVSAAGASACLEAWDAVLLAAGEGAGLSVDEAAGNALVAVVRIPSRSTRERP